MRRFRRRAVRCHRDTTLGWGLDCVHAGTDGGLGEQWARTLLWQWPQRVHSVGGLISSKSGVVLVETHP